MKQKFTSKIRFYWQKFSIFAKNLKLLDKVKPYIKIIIRQLQKIIDGVLSVYKSIKKNITNERKMLLLKIFLILLLICVYIVTTKIATLSSQNAKSDALVSGDVVTEVRNDTILGRSYAVKLHRTEVQEYDYWLYTDSVYNVGDKIEQ